ncbi:MAG: Eco57I restriction-modification methylase domain-containing protein [Christensenella sp.]|uniref:Eco57I restriction-modification methylase domain-containing protein n=1 Tax=Christensenella sp. TaxID=1935934 RepID=UPI002B21E96E|nr:Eco57I restriction-modification methylase domain-containing protein [Christensenella sp.]MEA5002265.1 Eco57I restriction-modification methylase domain-containing protein [Christensenella sp.]
MTKTGGKTQFKSAFDFKVIYAFTIHDEEHKGLIKIGDATLHTDVTMDNLPPNCRALNQAALERIKQYTNTVGITPVLLHTELAVKTVKSEAGEMVSKAFRDHEVHRVLENSGIKKAKIDESTGREWYKIGKETAIEAISAVKENFANLSNSMDNGYIPIVFRPEQKEAIELTIKQFKKNNRMLWNAKMRFGKTLSALEVIKRCQYEKTIILTHRPVVNDGWYDDFKKIFDGIDYVYGSKVNGYTVEDLLKMDKSFVYFASIQDLRGSEAVGGKFGKNDIIFNTEWDCVIVDEAHEGTKTALGDDTIKAIVKEELDHTKLLALSGTPFNIMNEYDENSIYTWDYIMEQECKSEWDKQHFGDSNPYDELPKMRIFTYNLGDLLHNGSYITYEDKAFNFHEFFRTWTSDYKQDYAQMPQNAKIGDFVHKEDIWSFLNLMSKEDANSAYPYSKEGYRSVFKHSLWMVPGVREAKALKDLMEKHPVFGSGQFNIVNVAGSNDEESSDALNSVRKAICKAEQLDTYTITLSCGKLTTGVTVKEWTAVFMLSGSFSTSAANYLQTIFRVQSPCNKEGKIKETAYVFDFAPDRTLKMVSEAVSVSSKAGKSNDGDKIILGKFLNYCPVISISGSQMKEYKADKLLQQLKKAYADKVVRHGFDDANLYNDELLKLQDIDIKKFEDLKTIIGKSKAAEKQKDISVNDQGLTNEEYEEAEKLKKKPKKNLTEEEKERLKELKEKAKVRNDAISILRGISIRMPLLIYGADIPYDEEITLERFVEKVDASSWKEFMPKGVTKELFNEFKKYYDEDVFIAAGRRIRNIAREADTLNPTERTKKIASLFSYFKNPDKETVLTPWRVVNMHMSDTLGGYDFYDEAHEEILEEPRFVDQGKVTADIFGNEKAQILEINSKTGLYPLYVVYSIYRTKCKKYTEEALTPEVQRAVWNDTVQKNMFVICNTPMAKLITRRTLVGYSDAKINAHYFDDLINAMKNKPQQFIERVLKPSYWKKEGVQKMKFDAIVGNPPYQEKISEASKNSSLSKQLFPIFIKTAIMVDTHYVSLITPSRWFTGDAQDKSFVKLREYIKSNNHIQKMVCYKFDKDIFNGVEIKGGVNYFLHNSKFNGKVEFVTCENNNRKTNYRNLFEDGLDVIIYNSDALPILVKIMNDNFNPLTSITTGRNPFGIIGKESSLDKKVCETFKEGLYEIRCKANVIKYIDKKEIKKNIDIFNNFKVFISKSAGNPNSDMKIIGTPYVGLQKTACTDSLITIGNFHSKYEAECLCNYIKTKFVRFLVSILKISQNVTQIVYGFVPLQDFTEKSDIQWNKSIPEIDEQLYSKYGLSEGEITFIEETIKHME